MPWFLSDRNVWEELNPALINGLLLRDRISLRRGIRGLWGLSGGRAGNSDRKGFWAGWLADYNRNNRRQLTADVRLQTKEDQGQ